MFAQSRMRNLVTTVVVIVSWCVAEFSNGFCVNRAFPIQRSHKIGVGCLDASRKKDHIDIVNITGIVKRREFVASSALSLVLSQAASSTGASTNNDDGTKEILSSRGVKQEYFKALPPFSTRRNSKDLVLSNGLRVLLVQDKQAMRASAALTIDGAGQFDEYPDVGGLAHLTEHMVSSATMTNQDFETWIGEKDGASNAFTAPSFVCYHFNMPQGDAFQSALGRFSWLFRPDAVKRACTESNVQREIRRVNSELQFDATNQATYLLKRVTANKAHPFSRFTQGSIESLGDIPKKRGINVTERVLQFFDNRYLPERAVLVVVSRFSIATMEQWIQPFTTSLSPPQNQQPHLERSYPTAQRKRNRPSQFVLYREDNTAPDSTEKLSISWFLSRNYDESDQKLTSSIIGFFISQLLDRRGPGSLHSFLLERGWVPKGNPGLPRISFPIDSSGFQLMKMELTLTMEGFLNRSAVIAAFYECLGVVASLSFPFGLPTKLLRQYSTTARMHGYALAPRPPDAVELAVDAQTYGVGGSFGVGKPGYWPLLPSMESPAILNEVSQGVTEILETMNDPNKANIIVTASEEAIAKSPKSLVDDSLPPLSSRRWRVEPVSGGKFLKVDMMKVRGKLEEWIAVKLGEDELLPPLTNPLIPTSLRPPRSIMTRSSGSRHQTYFSESAHGKDGAWSEFITMEPPSEKSSDIAFSDYALSPDWQLYQTPNMGSSAVKLPMPQMPGEATCRAAFVIQLLSLRPARANVEKAARAELWIKSFEEAITDLAELGAPAGLSYEMSFNRYGLRICFLGISQNLRQYTRKFCRRLVAHHEKFAEKSQVETRLVESVVKETNRLNRISPQRKRKAIVAIRNASAQDVAKEGQTFLASCRSAVCLAQGDMLPTEAITLANELEEQFGKVINKQGRLTLPPAVPDISDIMYKPMWKPRSAALFMIPGIRLISDACGRIPR